VIGLGNTRLKIADKPIIITKKADQTINSQIVLQDVTDLVFVLKPNTRYYVLVSGRMVSPSLADLDLTFKAITGTVYAHFNVTVGMSNVAFFGTEKTFVTSGFIQSLYVAGWLKTGSGGGTLQLQYAQNVSDVGNTTILEGSMLAIYELD